MTKNFHEHFQEAALTPPPARSTGLVFTGFAVVVAILFRQNPAVLWTALGLAGLLAGLSFGAPHLLQPLNLVWFRFALLLNKVMSPIIMLVLFAIAIVPFGLAMQLRRDPLRAKRRPDLDSYWLPRTPETTHKSDMTNQF